ncbi:hypothetical protein CRENBAI_015477 [Crenichthys baileyi]|uniref:DUF6729 domain-containing protein n=1 Tax=Crenichthys baileyi TaxID=28760 RepID=A0AAV9RRC7_9TELE
MMRERTHGNSVTQLYKKLQEEHGSALTRCALEYFTACEPFTDSSIIEPPVFSAPPPLLPLPKPKWLLSVYARDVLSWLPEVMAKITSVFDSVLKMDSTKKRARSFQFRESIFCAPIAGLGLFQFLDKLRPHSANIGSCPLRDTEQLHTHRFPPRRAPNGTLILKASTEAQGVGPQKGAYRAKPSEEVEADARAHVVREGGDVSNAALILSRCALQFGRYLGRTFLWLLENDVGYAVNLVASHQKERERTGSQSPLMANKDALLRYSSAYPDFLEAVRFHRAFQEAHARSLQPGQEGQALVGFGDFKYETLESLYESVDPKKIRFVNYLRRTSPAPGSQMEKAVGYVRRRDRQRIGATAAASAAATTTTTSSTSSGGASVSAPRPVSRTASHFAAFVSTRRSLSGVETQAALKKLSSSTKPAIPAASSRTSRPALSSRTPVEPSDEELVRATADTEKSSSAQACPASAAAAATSSTTSLPPRDADVSGQLGGPTDEEMLEATAEHEASTRDPPEPATVEDEDALFRQDPPPPANGAEMLPESWRAALSPDQQEWIGRTLFGRPRLTLPTSTCGGIPPATAGLQPASRIPRPLLRLSAVFVDASQDLAATADLPPAFVHRVHDQGWAVQDHPEGPGN